MGSDVKIERDAKGNIVGASLLQKDGTSYTLNVIRGSYTEGSDSRIFHFSNLDLYENAKKYASIKASFSDPVEKFKLEVDTPEGQMRVMQDYSGKNNTSEGGQITTILNDRVLKGNITVPNLENPSVKYENSQNQRDIMKEDDWLPSKIRDKIKLFDDVFKEFESNLKDKREVTRGDGGIAIGGRIMNRGLDGKPLVFDDKERGVWQWLGRAGCWAGGGLIAAGACAGTFGLGCALGAAGGGAAASICSDVVSDAD